MSRSSLWHVCAGFWELWNLISQCLPLCLLASLPLCLPQCLPLCLLLCRTSRTLDPSLAWSPCLPVVSQFCLPLYLPPCRPFSLSQFVSHPISHFASSTIPLTLYMSPPRSCFRSPCFPLYHTASLRVCLTLCFGDFVSWVCRISFPACGPLRFPGFVSQLVSHFVPHLVSHYVLHFVSHYVSHFVAHFVSHFLSHFVARFVFCFVSHCISHFVSYFVSHLFPTVSRPTLSVLNAGSQHVALSLKSSLLLGCKAGLIWIALQFR